MLQLLRTNIMLMMFVQNVSLGRAVVNTLNAQRLLTILPVHLACVHAHQVTQNTRLTA